MIQSDLANIIIKGLLTFSTYSIAVSSSIIKIFQYQEKLEHHIKIKQQWISFVVSIGTELQLPYNLRQDALYLIKTNKEKYLDLLRVEYEIPEDIKKTISYHMNKESPDDILGIKISQIMISILKNEKEIVSKIIEDPLYDGNMDICEYYLKKKLMNTDKINITNITTSNETIDKNSKLNKIPIINNVLKFMRTKPENNQVQVTRFSPSLNYCSNISSDPPILPIYNSSILNINPPISSSTTSNPPISPTPTSNNPISSTPITSTKTSTIC
jgi:hypothetical protein